jgi:dTDP-4-dehydrorhamnose 3,5-epimerase
MSKMDFVPTPIAGVTLVKRTSLGDSRGFLARLYCADSFRAAGSPFTIAQINHTLTQQKGTVRGMHFQYPPHAEAKLVSCVRGEIFDVAIDLRSDSPSFLRYFGAVLSVDNRTALLIPPGCAHGFQTLTDDCELIYLHSAAYEAGAEGAINAQDPRIGINWPLPIGTLSDRDRNHPWIDAHYKGIVL